MKTVDLLEDWMAAPSLEGAARLRAAIRLEPEYNPYRDISAHCDREFREGRVAALREMLLSLMPSQALSPSAHGMLARCHEALGDDAAAVAERRLMVLSVQAILRSGDGSAERPWTVLRTSDEYDALSPKEIEAIKAGQMEDPFIDRGSTIHEVERFKLEYRSVDDPRYTHQPVEIDARRAGTEYLDSKTPEELEELMP